MTMKEISPMNKELLNLRRRDFVKMCAAAAAGSIVPAISLMDVSDAVGQTTALGGKKTTQSPVRDVLPMVGTGWHGHMFPGAVAPFGLVQLSPDTSGPPDRRRGTARD